MTTTCPACEDYEFDDEDMETDWATCPNCDFPAKFVSWIRKMQKEIGELKEENQRLRRDLSHEHSMRGWYR